MRRTVFIIFVLAVSTQCLLAQKNECKQKPKRFPAAFTHMTTDYANMNVQADALPKHYFQIESSILFGTLFQEVNDESYYGYNANLLRVGMGRSLELRTVLSFPGKNLKYNTGEYDNIHPPLTLGVKLNLLPESSSTPGVAFILDYTYYADKSHLQPCVIIDKFAFNILKFSMSGGPQFVLDGSGSKLIYSLGIVMKERNGNIGIYSLASNRYNYMDNIFHMGLLFTDNLNFNFTAGYGVHEDHGLFMFSYSGLFNVKSLQSRFWGYF